MEEEEYPKLFRVIKTLTVKHNFEELSNLIGMKRGIKEDDSLNSLLFVLEMDEMAFLRKLVETN